MRVRRKSEIELLRELLEEIFTSMEANLTWLDKERTTPTDALAASGRTRLRLWRERAAAAHYEPVPEPPKSSRRMCTCLGSCRGKEGLGENWVCALDREAPENADVFKQRAAPSVSEERKSIAAQSGSVGTSISERSEEQPVVFAPSSLDLVPHRATIEMIPCKIHEGKFQVMVDSTFVSVEGDYSFWCGTEAEAKAKLESLSKNLAGEKG